ncbi:MAG: anti-anti-sigma factor [Legionellales bacterium]|nr:MAG: anti-anti-sigma factor [Legionellales bacterium]
MAITTQQSADLSTLTINVAGSLDLTQAQLFRDAYEKVIPRPNNFVVDLEDTENFSLSSLNLLLDLRDYSGKNHDAVQITNCNTTIKKIFAITQLQKEVNIH